MSANKQSLENQLELLISFENFIQNLQTHLIQTNSLYKKLISDMVDSGMISELSNKIENVNQPNFETEIMKIWSHLEVNDKAYASKLKIEIANTMDNIK